MAFHVIAACTLQQYFVGNGHFRGGSSLRCLFSFIRKVAAAWASVKQVSVLL